MNIAEVREFFLRNVKVSDGTLQDREKNYPLSHFVNKAFVDDDGLYSIRKVEVGNRFLEGDVPAVETWSKLLQSIPFFLNLESNASNSRQGLVKIATDAQVASSTEKDTDGFYLVPTAKQLGNKSSIIVDYPTLSGEFITNNNVKYMLELKSINKILHVRLILRCPYNAVESQQITINCGTSNTKNLAVSVMNLPDFGLQFNARQTNGDIPVTIMKRNISASVVNTNVVYDTGWKMVL